MSNCSRPDSRRKLIIFVRAPIPGSVKTRLAATLGAEAAAEAYKTLVETVLERLSSLGPVELHYAPREATGEVEPWLRPGWRALPQQPGDLGSRMNAAFISAFASGANRVALIGSDCPEVEAADIECAWAKLDEHDVVIGPATDGGYWLIALSRSRPDLFGGIPWSTSAVLARTLAQARVAGLRPFLLRALSDVDTEREWMAFRARTVRGY